MITAAILAASLLTPASVGVGISGFPACMGTPAQPGHAYTLSVSVFNTGDGSESISLAADPPVNGLKGTPFPASWVSFGYPRLLWIIGQSSVTVAPGKSAEIPVTVNVPGNAKAALYGANLVATSGGSPSPGGGGQAVLGAGAEDDLSFAVAPAKAPSCDPYAAPAPAKAARPTPEDACPTATSGPAASSAPSYCRAVSRSPYAAPAYSPAAATGGVGPNRDAWVVLAGLAVLGVAMLAKRRRS